MTKKSLSKRDRRQAIIWRGATQLEKDKGFLSMNVITQREGDSWPMFYIRKDGTIVAMLKGYLIAPAEKYDLVLKEKK